MYGTKSKLNVSFSVRTEVLTMGGEEAGNQNIQLKVRLKPEVCHIGLSISTSKIPK